MKSACCFILGFLLGLFCLIFVPPRERIPLFQGTAMKRICRMCHKPSTRKLCRTCEKVKRHHDNIEEERVAKLRESGWLPPEVTPIRNNRSNP